MVDARKVTRAEVREAVEEGLRNYEEKFGRGYTVGQVNWATNKVMMLLHEHPGLGCEDAVTPPCGGTRPGEERSPYR